jgi:hypothetical protein
VNITHPAKIFKTPKRGKSKAEAEKEVQMKTWRRNERTLLHLNFRKNLSLLKFIHYLQMVDLLAIGLPLRMVS